MAELGTGAAELRTTVFAAVPAIIAELNAIEKGDRAPAAMGGYAFRGIDHIVAALHPLLAKHGVFVTPQLVELTTEHLQTGGGKDQVNRVARYRFRFYGSDGSYFDAETVSEGIDTRDKGCNKAATAAFKIALTQVFAIHSADSPDPDSEDVPERGRRVNGNTAPPPPPPEPHARAWWVGKPEAEAVVRDIGLWAAKLGGEHVEATRLWLQQFARRAATFAHEPNAERERLAELQAKAGQLAAQMDSAGSATAADVAPNTEQGATDG